MPLMPPSRLGFAALVIAIGCAAPTPAAPQERAAPAAPAADPVAVAITEASRRFGVPQHWIRAVIRVESAGERNAVSRAGAMGLMQIMPATYAELRRQLGLGSDPFNVRDNILAGTAYLRQMHDRYGAPGFLAAYNAGPGRWESYLAGRRALPSETIHYLARLAPELGFPREGGTRTVTPPLPASPFEAPLFVQTSVRSAMEPLHPDHQHTDEIATADRPRVAQNDRQTRSSDAVLSRVDSGAENAQSKHGDAEAIGPRSTPPPAESALFVPRTRARNHQP